jgi:hypothetical protein
LGELIHGVNAQDELKFGATVLALQVLKRADAKRRALMAKLSLTYCETGIARDRQLDHRKTLTGASAWIG